MREKPIDIQFEFDPNGKNISKLLEESFILFLQRTFANPQGKAVQCPR